MEIRKNIELLRNYILLKYGIDRVNTANNYCCALAKFLNYFKECPEPKAISDNKIVNFLLTIPGRSNRATHHSAIKKFFMLKGQPGKIRFIPYPEKEDKLPVHVNLDEFLALITVCNNQKHRAIISLMYDCGLRVSEVVNLKISDIDSSNMQIIIIQSKGRKDRKIKLTQVLLALLRSYFVEYKPKDYLFEGQFKEQYSQRSCQEIVKQLCKKAGIKKNFSPHKFRHGFAMALLENGSTMAEIQNQMGHESEKTTKIYARMNNRVIQKIESPMEQLVRIYNIQSIKSISSHL